ncbi:MAG: prepilin-type N-terminal cleavage/methylation domain-containing protein, partial [Pirellulaceae bacterium]
MASRHWAGDSPAPHRHRRSSRRRGFSLIEAMVAITILALAGSVLLLGVESSLQTTSDAVDRTIADGLAQQLLDEITTRHFKDPSQTSSTGPLGPEGSESSASGREQFNDTDDYHQFEAQPVEGLWGEPIGTGDDGGNPRHAAFQSPAQLFQNWRQRIEVYFVDPSDHSV